MWTKRCQVICDQLNFEDPDIFGTQEVLVGQLHDLLKGLDGYGYVGVGRDDGKEDGEYSAIFYKKDRLELLQKGNFWLNETPDKPVLGWDAACVRICSWGEPERDGLPLLLLQSPHGPHRHCGSPRGCQAGGEED